MSSLFNVTYLFGYTKKGNLSSESHSSVKSTKFFPIYSINGKDMIFKPMSKTKPLTTPLFSYSEVYWSYVINKYFDSLAPRYYLSVGKKDDLEEKYYEKGVLVEKINNSSQKLINLYDYLKGNPQDDIDIENYINYCMKVYDYTHILNSKFVLENIELGEEIAYQVLLSILRMDQNFHYENINFLEEEGSIKVSPPIDFEFSNFFLYPDDYSRNSFERDSYFKSISIPLEKTEDSDLFKELCRQIGLDDVSANRKNIICIVKKYPSVVSKFISNLDKFINDIRSIKLDDPDNYIDKFNSDYWNVYHYLYKENNSEKAHQLEQSIELKEVDKEVLFARITSEIYEYSIKLRLILKIYLFAYTNNIVNLEEITLNDLYYLFENKESINGDVSIFNELKVLLKK